MMIRASKTTGACLQITRNRVVGRAARRGLRPINFICTAALLCGCANTVDSYTDSNSARANTASNGVYELRTYTTHPGKLDDLHRRFSNHTMQLFEKHGITNVAYWTPSDTPNTLIYVVSHKSREDAAAAWKSFVADPVWRKAYAESRTDGPLVTNIDSVFMSATSYSPPLNSASR